MSIDLTEFVWRTRGVLSASEKLVMLRIADRINRKNGVAWPSLQSLADDCGFSWFGTQQILARLIENGYLQVVTEHSGRRPRTYRIDLDRLGSGQPGCGLQPDSGQPGWGLRGMPPGDRSGQRGELALNHVVANPQPGCPEPLEPELEPEVQTTGVVAPADSFADARAEEKGRDGVELADFQVYAAIGVQAVDSALQERNERPSNVLAHFQRRCVERQVRYDPCLAGRAIDDAWRRVDTAGESFVEQCRRMTGGRVNRVRR